MAGSATRPATDDGARAPRRSRTMTLEFSEHRVPVRFVGAPEVAEHMRRSLHDWDVSLGTNRAAAPVVVRGTAAGYRVESIWLDAPVTGLSGVAAACCALIDVLECLLDADPSLLCLHAAAAEIAGRLVVLTGPSHVGKSTLAARLSCEDLVLFCDDMLPLDPDGHGIAVGLGPRLRLPLPAAASPAFRAHVARHLGPADERYGFIRPPTIASYGRRAPVGAIVLLDRQPSGPALFRRAEPAEVLEALIRRNIAPRREPAEVLDRLHQLAGEVPCRRLEYSDLEEAATLVTRSFAHWPPRDLRPQPARPATLEPKADTPAPPPDPAHRYRRRGDVAMRRVDGEVFVSQAEERRILRLNPVGGAVWTLLEDPATVSEITRDLAIAFPDIPRATIEADVARIVGDMIAFALVRPHDGAT